MQLTVEHDANASAVFWQALSVVRCAVVAFWQCWNGGDQLVGIQSERVVDRNDWLPGERWRRCRGHSDVHHWEPHLRIDLPGRHHAYTVSCDAGGRGRSQKPIFSHLVKMCSATLSTWRWTTIFVGQGQSLMPILSLIIHFTVALQPETMHLNGLLLRALWRKFYSFFRFYTCSVRLNISLSFCLIALIISQKLLFVLHSVLFHNFKILCPAPCFKQLDRL